MSGYIAILCHICMQILNLHNSEMLDRFVQGLKLSLLERLMEQAPKTFEDAACIAECASLAQWFFQH